MANGRLAARKALRSHGMEQAGKRLGGLRSAQLRIGGKARPAPKV